MNTSWPSGDTWSALAKNISFFSWFIQFPTCFWLDAVDELPSNHNLYLDKHNHNYTEETEHHFSIPSLHVELLIFILIRRRSLLTTQVIAFHHPSIHHISFLFLVIKSIKDILILSHYELRKPGPYSNSQTCKNLNCRLFDYLHSLSFARALSLKMSVDSARS